MSIDRWSSECTGILEHEFMLLKTGECRFLEVAGELSQGALSCRV